MQPPYSTTFISKAGFSGTASFPVPIGYRAIASCLDVYGNVLGLSNVFFHNPDGGTIWWETWNPGDRKSVGWRGHHVWLQGQTITIECDIAPLDSVDLTLSGYLLLEAP